MLRSKFETLLDLDGQILVQEYGFWVKIEAREVEPTDQRPHGVKYSLTLHRPDGERVMGFDNAHGLRRKGKQPLAHGPFDHNHRFGSRQAVSYDFMSAEQLVSDFFAEVDRVLREVCTE
jgi:hypothetical protein